MSAIFAAALFMVACFACVFALCEWTVKRVVKSFRDDLARFEGRKERDEL